MPSAFTSRPGQPVVVGDGLWRSGLEFDGPQISDGMIARLLPGLGILVDLPNIVVEASRIGFSYTTNFFNDWVFHTSSPISSSGVQINGRSSLRLVTTARTDRMISALRYVGNSMSASSHNRRLLRPRYGAHRSRLCLAAHLNAPNPPPVPFSRSSRLEQGCLRAVSDAFGRGRDRLPWLRRAQTSRRKDRRLPPAFPPVSGDLLMRGDHEFTARSGDEVAHDSGFEIHFGFHSGSELSTDRLQSLFSPNTLMIYSYFRRAR
jgi:hypothetical protein